MAVVVDRSFFNAMGKMEEVGDISNADIAWFIVNYREGGSHFDMYADAVVFTTLEKAVEGLTAGLPVTQEVFEGRIREKMTKECPKF